MRAKIYHKPIESLHRPTETITAEAKAGGRSRQYRPLLVLRATVTAFNPETRPRSWRGKASLRMAGPSASRKAPPTPCSLRATIKKEREGAAPTRWTQA